MKAPGAGSNSISCRTKVIAFVAVWLLALFATNPSLTYWALAYLFPIGLFQIFYPPALRDGGWDRVTFCFAIYLAIAVFFFRTKTKLSTVVWFLILVALLVCNVSGCRTILNSH